MKSSNSRCRRNIVIVFSLSYTESAMSWRSSVATKVCAWSTDNKLLHFNRTIYTPGSRSNKLCVTYEIADKQLSSSSISDAKILLTNRVFYLTFHFTFAFMNN